MVKLLDWREIVKMSVVSFSHTTWDKYILRNIIWQYVDSCLERNFLENNGKICTTLSGGVDSSLCLAMIRKIVGDKVEIHTFTTGESETHPDIIFARIVSRLFNTIHYELIPKKKDIDEAQKEMNADWLNEVPNLGDVAVFLTYKNIKSYGFESVIAHDGIDELMGGYWEHRKHESSFEQEKAFKNLWEELPGKHLLPLEKKANKFGINLLFPYLQKGIVEYVSMIPVWHRTNTQKSKIPLKAVAEDFLPHEIVDRKKTGFCDALKEF